MKKNEAPKTILTLWKWSIIYNLVFSSITTLMIVFIVSFSLSKTDWNQFVFYLYEDPIHLLRYLISPLFLGIMVFCVFSPSAVVLYLRLKKRRGFYIATVLACFLNTILVTGVLALLSYSHMRNKGELESLYYLLITPPLVTIISSLLSIWIITKRLRNRGYRFIL